MTDRPEPFDAVAQAWLNVTEGEKNLYRVTPEMRADVRADARALCAYLAEMGAGLLDLRTGQLLVAEPLVWGGGDGRLSNAVVLCRPEG